MPLFFIRSLIFGKELVSLPFCDYGGILADSPEISQLLFQKAEELMRSLRCKNIELRQVSKQHFLDKKAAINTNLSIKTTKVRMFLNLPESADTLFSSFPAKLRSQIRKPQKDGCTCLNGGIELLDDFYDVFLFNMRDLGSPVHSKQIIKNMLSSYPRSSHIFVVYHSQGLLPALWSVLSMTCWLTPGHPSRELIRNQHPICFCTGKCSNLQ